QRPDIGAGCRKWGVVQIKSSQHGTGYAVLGYLYDSIVSQRNWSPLNIGAISAGRIQAMASRTVCDIGLPANIEVRLRTWVGLLLLLEIGRSGQQALGQSAQNENQYGNGQGLNCT